jgi:ferritin-like metal-binding protein YciE
MAARQVRNSFRAPSVVPFWGHGDLSVLRRCGQADGNFRLAPTPRFLRRAPLEHRGAASPATARNQINPRLNMSPKEQLVTWLNSAYSMEHNLAKVLENHAKDAKDHPEMRRRIEQHLEETRQHADSVEECLAALDEKPSKVKSAMGNIMGSVHGASTGMFRDEMIKNCLADYSAEHFEIACYRSLIVAAEEEQQPEIARICREILEEEEAMARWLEDQIPDVTRMMLQQAAHA